MRSAKEIKNRLLETIFLSFQRPGMYASTSSLDVFYYEKLKLLSFIDNKENEFEIELQRLRDLEYMPSSMLANVKVSFEVFLPEVEFFSCEIASVYLEVAWRLGYIKLKNTISELQYEKMKNEVQNDEWLSKDYDSTQLYSFYGEPSFICGQKVEHSEQKPSWGTWCYVLDKNNPWIHFDMPIRYSRKNMYVRNTRLVETTQDNGLRLTNYGKTITSRGHYEPFIISPD